MLVQLETKMSRMPAFYIPHGGGPCFFMDWNPPHAWDKTAEFLRSVAPSLPRRPRAILLISAHWLEPVFTVGSAARPTLIYDYYGFPAHTYQLRYDAPGDPALAASVLRLLADSHIAAGDNPERGYDHGVFIPLKVMFPEAAIPVVQMSLRSDLDPQAHIDVGRALAPLRRDDVLIVGSGMSFHNMRAYGNPAATAISADFDAWLTATIQAPAEQRERALAQWTQAPQARLCHPPGGEEHLIPLMVAAGAGHEGEGRHIFSDIVMETCLSGYRFD